MNAWWLFCHQAGVPPREPITPRRRSCAWCGGLLDGNPARKYCCDQCCSKASTMKKAAQRVADQMASVG